MVLDRCGTPVYQGCVLLVFVSWAWSTSVSAVLTWTVRLDKTGGLTNPSQVGVGPGNQKLSYQDETTLMNPKNHLNSPASAAWPAQDFPIPVVPTWPGCCKGNSLHSSKFEDIKVFKVGQKKTRFQRRKKLSASRSRSSDFRWMRRYLPWGKRQPRVAMYRESRVLKPLFFSLKLNWRCKWCNHLRHI